MKATYSLALNTLEGKQSFYNELVIFGYYLVKTQIYLSAVTNLTAC